MDIPATLTLDIISDPVCPWCYIGKTHLDTALREAGRDPFQIAWRPFQLNPDMPAEGMGRQAYLEAKFGGPDGAARVYGQVAAAAEDAGLTIDFDAIPRQPNTLDAHRLIRWSHAEGAQHRIAHLLFVAFFEERLDIGELEVLVEVAEAAGLDGRVISEMLEEGTDRDEVAAEDAAIRKMGVQGVPCFIVAGQHVVQGAQPPALWARVLDEIA